MASRSVGNIIVDLQARTAKFEDGMNKATKRLRKLEKRVHRSSRLTSELGGAMRRLAGPAAIGAAVVGITALIRKQSQAIDITKKFADRIGASTKAVSELAFAAEMTGISSTTMNMALQRMTRRISEAAQGGGEAVKALKELGLNAREINTLPLDRKMARIADAFTKVNSSADRLRLAFKLFDSEGADMVRLLGQGSEALREFQEEARLLGQSIGGRAAADVEKGNDRLNKMKLIVVGFGRQLAADVIPTLGKLADMIVEWVKALGGVPMMYAKIKLWIMEASLALNRNFKPAIVTVMDLGDRFAKMWEVIKLSAIVALEAIRGMMQDVELGFAALASRAALTVRDVANTAANAAGFVKLGVTKSQLAEVATSAQAASNKIRLSMVGMQAEADRTKTSTQDLKAAWDAFIGADEDSAGGANLVNSTITAMEMGIARLKAQIAGGMTDTGAAAAEAPEGGAAAGGDNMWLKLMGLSEQANLAARRKIIEFQMWAVKSSFESQQRIKKQEQAQMMQRVANTENWAAATFNILRAFGGASLEQNKGFAIAEAVVNTALGVTKTIAQGGGMNPATWAAVAAVVASGAAQIAAISRASYGGGASFGGGGSGGGGGQTGPQPEPTAAAPVGETQRNIDITVNGVITRQAVEEIGTILEELKRDGAMA